MQFQGNRERVQYLIIAMFVHAVLFSDPVHNNNCHDSDRFGVADLARISVLEWPMSSSS